MTRQKIKGIKGNKPVKVPKGKPMPSIVDLAAQSNHITLAAALQGAKKSMLTPEELRSLPFLKKLHHILAQPKYQDCLCWTPDGRCIRVVDPFKLQEKMASDYFTHKSFSSFLVDLEGWGFKKVSHLGFQECYYHDVSKSEDEEVLVLVM